MKKVKVNKDKRNKAFIGAAIGAVGGILGSIFGAKKKKKMEEEQWKRDQTNQNKADTLQAAQAQTSGVADQSYVEQYQKKTTLKMGGKEKFNDRIKSVEKKNKFIKRCGGRKKSELGSDNKWTKQDTSNLISGVGTGIQNAIGGASGQSSNSQFTPSNLADNTNTANNNKIAAEVKAKRETTPIDIGTKQKLAMGDTGDVNFTAGKKNITSSSARYGTKKRTKYGIGGEIGGAAGGIGSLVGSLMAPSKPPKEVKKADGFSTSAPKVGIQQPDYQSNPNASQAAVIAGDNKFINRDERMKCGGKKRMKRK